MSAHYVGSVLATHTTLVVTLFTIFAGSLAAGLAGFAFSAITGEVLFHLLAPVEAVPLLLACSITTQLFSISKLWHTMQWRQCLPYLVGGFAGIPIGAALLKAFDPHIFVMGFGLFLISYSLYMLLRPNFVVRGRSHYAEVAEALPAASPAGLRPFPEQFPPSGVACEASPNSSSEVSSNLSFCSCKSQR